MNDALKIMDEMRHQRFAVGGSRWYQLRAAIEAQAEELAHIEAELSAGQGDDDGDQILPDFREDSTTAQKVCECLHLLEVRRDVIEAQRKTLQIKDEELVHLRAGSARIWKKLAQARNDLERMEDAFQRRVVLHAEALARIGRLEQALRWYANSDRYEYDETCVPDAGLGPDEDILADDGTRARDALNESPRQSLAAVKAEALRKAAETLCYMDDYGTEYITPAVLEREAERIEREAKES